MSALKKPLQSLCVVLLVLSSTFVSAQENTSELDDIRARLEALESQDEPLAHPLESAPAPAQSIAPMNWEADSDFESWQPPAPEPVPRLDYSRMPQHYFPHTEGGVDQPSMHASWHHGLELKSADEAFRIHLGGQTQFDASWYDADSDVQRNINTPYEDGVDLRRARLRADGTMYEFIDFAFEYDFVNAVRARDASGGTTDFAVPGFTDFWWTFTKLPSVGNIRVGNHKEPIGFEHLVSYRWLPFLERSYNQDTFYGGAYNGFTPGISAFNNYAEERGSWQIGLFKPTDNVFAYNANTGDYAVTGRATYLPMDSEASSQLLHVGTSARLASTVDGRARFRTRDAVRAGIVPTWPVPADTGTLFGDNNHFLNYELVGVSGPWTFQSEYLYSFLPDASARPGGPDVGTLTYHGGYMQVLYYLTGESDYDHYNRKTAVFERIYPAENFLVSKQEGITGIGAWQVGARYNYLDLNDEGLNGGRLNNFTLGLNWFLNPNMKIQFNTFATDRDAPLIADRGDGWITGFGVRFNQDF